MHEVTNKSEVESATKFDLRELHWSPLHRGLQFLAAAESFTTSVYAAMASAAAGVAIILSILVSLAFIALAAPLSIVAAALVAGTVMKSRKKSKRNRLRVSRVARRARNARQSKEIDGQIRPPLQTETRLLLRRVSHFLGGAGGGDLVHGLALGEFDVNAVMCLGLWGKWRTELLPDLIRPDRDSLGTPCWCAVHSCRLR
jgi:hypothetical protein